MASYTHDRYHIDLLRYGYMNHVYERRKRDLALIEQISEAAAKVFCVQEWAMKTRRRPHHIAMARAVAMCVAWEFGCTTVAIALYFRRDHSTVIANRDKYMEDPRYRLQINRVKEMVRKAPPREETALAS